MKQNAKSLLLLLSLLLCFTAQADETSLKELKEQTENSVGDQKIDALNKLSALLSQDKPSEAENYAQSAYDLASAAGNQVAMATACDNLGTTFLARYDYTNAMKHFVAGLKIRNELGDQKGIATSKNYIGWVFCLQEDMPSALNNLTTALEIRKAIEDLEGASETYENLGYVYLFKKLYGKAREEYSRAMELRVELDQLPEAAKLASHLGKIARDMGDHEGALVYYNQSLGLNNSLRNMEGVGDDYTNIALVYLSYAKVNVLDKEEFLEEALDANTAAFKIRNTLPNKLDIAESFQLFGTVYCAMNDKVKGKSNLEQSVALLNKIGPEPGTQYVFKSISETYHSINDYEQAFLNHKAYSTFRDVIFNKEKSTALLELTTKYESEFAAEKQEQKIAALESEKEFNTKLGYFMMALLGLGIMLLAVMFYSYRRKQRDNQLLRTKNEEINRQKSEIDEKNDELQDKNASLDVLNQKLVKEMAERESIEQSSFARDRFLATMSHEMRTPMNIIIGLTHLLLAEKPREDQIEHLRTLQFSANNLVVFINDVLDFSKIEAGKLTLENREFNPRATLDEIHQRFILPAREKNLKFNCSFDKKIPETLLGDPARLNQILTNLVSNAVEYTERGGVEVEMKLQGFNKNEVTLFINVEDTGAGIDPEKLNEIFRKFSSERNADNFEGYASAGLGLAITKRLIDLQNGNIEVESVPNKGTTFIVQLPYKVVEERKGNKVKSKMPKEKTYDHLSDHRILLVEDNKINQLVVAKMLRKLGMEVITADDGLQALDAFSREYFDLVLMDIQMPKMDGYRATAEIRKSTDPRKRDVPIIALTASAFLTEREKAKLFGMNDHVGKPFGPDDLLDKISNCLAVYKM